MIMYPQMETPGGTCTPKQKYEWACWGRESLSSTERKGVIALHWGKGRYIQYIALHWGKGGIYNILLSTEGKGGLHNILLSTEGKGVIALLLSKGESLPSSELG